MIEGINEGPWAKLNRHKTNQGIMTEYNSFILF